MFQVGQLVVRIGSGQAGGYGCESVPKRGEVCTVRDSFNSLQYGDLIRTEEHRNPPLDYRDGVDECAFEAKCFRPVDDSKLAIFRQALVPGPRQRVTV